jgi:hypothetical protein
MDISAICNAAAQIRQRSLFNKPTTRYDTVSPYPNFSKFQLDMRRKAEVLQYKPSSINNLTNKLTKKQVLARALSGLGQVGKSNRNSSCPSDLYIPTPSYKSNVPGTPFNIYLDPNIPLYNFNSNVLNQANNYSELPSPGTTSKWITSDFSKNTFCKSNVQTSLFQMYITEIIDKPYYTYSLNIPIAIALNGVFPDKNFFQYFIGAATLQVYYGDQAVNTHINNYNVFVNTDISYNFIVDVSNQFNLATYKDVSLNSFGACQFLANIPFNNIKLYTQHGFIYDFRLTVSIIPSSNNSLSFDPSGLYAVLNPTPNIFYTKNCRTIIKNNNQTLSGFLFNSF